MTMKRCSSTYQIGEDLEKRKEKKKGLATARWCQHGNCTHASLRGVCQPPWDGGRFGNICQILTCPLVQHFHF